MARFQVDTVSMREQSGQLDQLTQAVTRARGEAAVTLAEGAFGRLPSSAALHAAFRLCTGRVTSHLDEATSALATAAEGVSKVAGNYEELDRRGAERMGTVLSYLS